MRYARNQILDHKSLCRAVLCTHERYLFTIYDRHSLLSYYNIYCTCSVRARVTARTRTRHTRLLSTREIDDRPPNIYTIVSAVDFTHNLFRARQRTTAVAPRCVHMRVCPCVCAYVCAIRYFTIHGVVNLVLIFVNVAPAAADCAGLLFNRRKCPPSARRGFVDNIGGANDRHGLYVRVNLIGT